MSAARTILTLLAAVLLLSACERNFIPPITPKDPPDQDGEPTVSISSVWERDFDRDRVLSQTYLAVGDAGTVYVSTNAIADRVEAPELHGALVVIAPETGQERTRTPLLFPSAVPEINGLVPARDDSAIVFGRLKDVNPTPTYRSFVQRILADGTQAWTPHVEFGEPGRAVTIAGGTAAPDGGALLFGRSTNLTTQEAKLWLAHVSPAGVVTRSATHPYGDEESVLFAGAYSPISPFGDPSGVLYILRTLQTCADPSVENIWKCPKVLREPVIDLIDAESLTVITRLQGLRDPNPFERYEDILATDQGDVYVVGWQTLADDPYDYDVFAFKYQKEGGKLLFDAFGGTQQEQAYFAVTGADGRLLMGGTTLAAMGGTTGRWPKQTGDGRSFIAEVGEDLELEWVHLPGDFTDEWRLRGIAHHPDYGYFLAGVNNRAEHFITRLERDED